MAAVLHRHWGGEGQHIDVSIFEVACGTADRRMTHVLVNQYTGENSSRESSVVTALPSGHHPALDGFANWTVSPQARWTRFVDLLDAPSSSTIRSSRIP